MTIPFNPNHRWMPAVLASLDTPVARAIDSIFASAEQTPAMRFLSDPHNQSIIRRAIREMRAEQEGNM